MKKAFVFLVLGTGLGFLFNHFLSSYGGVGINLYYAFAFGLAWAMAFALDTPKLSMPVKLGISFLGIGLLVLLGFIFFTGEIAVPSVIRFSMIFVLYYLIASFRPSKSLRQ